MSKSQDCSGCFLVASPYLNDGHFFRTVVFVIRHSGEGAFGVVINRGTSNRFSDAVEMSSPSWNPPQAKPFQSPPDSASPSDSASQPGSASSTDSTSQSNSGSAEPVPRDGIYIGGPVEGPLLVLHEIAGIGEPCGLQSGAETDPPGATTTLHDHPAEAFGSMSIQYADAPAWLTADEDHLRLLVRRDDTRLKFIVGYSGWGPRQLDHELEAGGWLVTPADADSIFEHENDVWEKLVHRCGRAILKDLRPDLSLPDEGDAFDPGLN